MQRNRFYEGDELETVSNLGGKTLKATEIYDEKGNRVPDCKYVMQKLFVKTDVKLEKYDMLRKKIN